MPQLFCNFHDALAAVLNVGAGEVITATDQDHDEYALEAYEPELPFGVRE